MAERKDVTGKDGNQFGAEISANDAGSTLSQLPSPVTPDRMSIPGQRGPSDYTGSGYQEKSDSPEWDALLAALAAEIKVRHYSRKTLKTYANWSGR